MRNFNWLLAILLLFLVVAALACQPQPAGPPATEIGPATSQPDDEEEMVINPATIHTVRVSVSPPQASVYIQGGLPDGCTAFHDLQTERSGNTVTITVTTQRPKDRDCSQTYRMFNRHVSLGSDFVSGQTYTLNVNDQTTTFVME